VKITSIEAGALYTPLHRPFKTALRTVETVQSVIVTVRTDEGVCGYGEAPPTAVITGETMESIAAAVRGCIAPALQGGDPEQLDELFARLDSCMVHNTSAKAAVDMALYDLYGKILNRPLYQLLGGRRRCIETDLTISVNPVDQMVADSLAAVAEGYRILKVKVGKEGLADVQRMQAIRQAVGPDIALRVDANQGWNAKQAVRIIRQMEDAGLDIDLVEQPVPAHDLDGMAAVTAAVSTPILADESVFSPADALEVIRRHAADLINIKLMKTGGIHGALRVCAIAETCGVECMVGCMLETKLAVSAAAHLAAAKGIVTRADLDGPGLCRIDPYEGGPVYTAGRIEMPCTPGIGITGMPTLETI